jgi:hypothetical protein
LPFVGRILVAKRLILFVVGKLTPAYAQNIYQPRRSAKPPKRLFPHIDR